MYFLTIIDELRRDLMSVSIKALDAPLLQWSDFEALEGEAENRCSNPKDLPKAVISICLLEGFLRGAFPVRLQTRFFFGNLVR